MGSGVVLHQAYTKYGLANFKKEILQFYNGIDELNQGEIFYIAKFNSTNKTIGYNLTYGGDGFGVFTDEIRKKISEARKGKKLSEESKQKISEALKGRPGINNGKIFSEEHRRKISEAKKGRQLSEETRQKMSETRKGKKHKKHKPFSEETKQRMSEAQRGEKNGFFGKRHSEETRQKLRLAWQRRKLANNG